MRRLSVMPIRPWSAGRCGNVDRFLRRPTAIGSSDDDGFARPAGRRIVTGSGTASDRDDAPRSVSTFLRRDRQMRYRLWHRNSECKYSGSPRRHPGSIPRVPRSHDGSSDVHAVDRLIGVRPAREGNTAE